jgi:hypothetical protein
MRTRPLLDVREKLREHHVLGQEIAQAITSAPLGETIDADDLESELNSMEQEALDEKMLKGGTVPVGDSIGRLPAAANGEREKTFLLLLPPSPPFLPTSTTISPLPNFCFHAAERIRIRHFKFRSLIPVVSREGVAC